MDAIRKMLSRYNLNSVPNPPSAPHFPGKLVREEALPRVVRNTDHLVTVTLRVAEQKGRIA
eukprot:1048104-Karenia_brevis.AAC.1